MGGMQPIGHRVEAEPIEQSGPHSQELLHVRAEIEMDGSSATLTMHTSEGQVDVTVTLDQLAAASAEIGRAGLLMLRRLAKRPDKIKSAFEELLRSAPQPEKIIPLIDPGSGDVVVVYRFDDRLPLPVRLTLEQIRAAQCVLSSEIRRTAN